MLFKPPNLWYFVMAALRYFRGNGKVRANGKECGLQPQIEWFKTREVYSLTNLEATSLKSRCPWSFSPSGVPQYPLACLVCGYITPVSASVSHCFLLCVSVFSSSVSFACLSLKKTSVIGFRAHLDSPGCCLISRYLT